MLGENIHLKVSLPGRYASALFKEACAQDSLEQIQDNIRALSSLISENPALFKILQNKALRSQTLTKLIEEIGTMMHFSNLFINFLKTITLNQRIKCLRQIFESFDAQVDSKNKTLVVRLEILSKTPEATQAIEDFIKERYPDQNLRFEYFESRALLGGFRAFIKDLCLDYSLKGRLDRLSYQLKKA